MSKQPEYVPDFLKVTGKAKAFPIRDLGYVLEAHAEMTRSAALSKKPDSRNFGGFVEKFRTLDFAVLQFDPFSADCGFRGRDTAYKTREKALAAAVQYLEINGYKAQPFDLFGMIDRV